MSPDISPTLYTLQHTQIGHCVLYFTSSTLAFLLLAGTCAPLAYAQEVSSAPAAASAPVSQADAPSTSAATQQQAPGATADTSAMPQDPSAQGTVDPSANPANGIGISSAEQPAVTGKQTTATPAQDAAQAQQISAMNSTAVDDPTYRRYAVTEKGAMPQSEVFTGALDYKVPISTPPGRNGIQPSLELTYNSQKAGNGSVWGSGWDLNIPVIKRLNKKGTQVIFSSTSFYSSLDGELVPDTGTTYRPKIENGGFRTYVFTNGAWTVTDKNGQTYAFGTSASSRQDDPSNAANVYAWYIDTVRDTNANTMQFVFVKDSGAIYPDTITYAGIGSTAGPFSIVFSREARTDMATSSETGFPVVTKYRIKQIQTVVSGSWVRTYALGYSAGDNGATSLLTSVTQSGRNESGATVTLPTETYHYQSGQDGWSNQTSWSFPEAICGDGSNYSDDLGVRFADINGDSLIDIVKSTLISGIPSVLYSGVYLNTGTGWQLNASWTVPDVFTYQARDWHGSRLVDVNGDGLLDFLVSYSDTTPVLNVYINTGNGWYLDTRWQLPVLHLRDRVDLGVRYGELNGDGLVDIVDNSSVYLNTGYGWQLDASWTVPVLFTYNTRDAGGRLEDINGDGLADLMRSYRDSQNRDINEIYVNTGHGWTLAAIGAIPVIFTRYGEDWGVRFMDVNGDKLTDIVQSYLPHQGSEVRTVYINTGNLQWAADASWMIQQYFVDAASGHCTGVAPLDINNDGMVDIIQSHTTATSTNINTRVQEIIDSVSYPSGGSTAVTYKTSTKYVNQNGANINSKLPYALQTVSALTHNDGKGHSATESYAYGGGEYHFGGPFDREFAGFATTTKTDPLGNVTVTYYHQGDGSQTALGEYQDHASKIGKPYRIERYDNTGKLFDTTINRWDRAALNATSSFVKLASTLTMTYDGNSDHRDTATAYTYNDTNGNITNKTECGEVTGAQDGSFTDLGTDKRTTDTTYAASSTAYLVGLPSQETIKDAAGAVVADTKYYYDTLGLGAVTKGNRTKTEQWIGGSTWVTSQRAYNNYSLPTSDTDPRGKVTSYGYDAYNLYPQTTTNPLGQTTTRLYDYSSGNAATTTDPNGLNTVTVFDGFDRPILEKQPDTAAPSTLVTKATYAYTDTKTDTNVKQVQYLTASTSVMSYRYYDGLGRLIQTRAQAENANTYRVNDRSYNERGELAKESLPYFSTGSARTSPNTTTALFTTYTYDAIGRPKRVTNAVGATGYTYDQWRTTVTDALGTPKDLTHDAFDQLVCIDEHNGASTYTTQYTYDPLQNLTKITDALGNVRSFTYDGLGRRTKAEDIHAPSDTTFGVYYTGYDATGNVSSSTDPRGLVLNYTYDNGNRPLTEDYLGATGVETSYAYDTCTLGKGKLCSVSTAGAQTAYTYDALGRSATEARTIGGMPYTTSYMYDRAGNLTVLTYPDASQVQYLYNAAGLVDAVQRKDPGGSFTNVVTSIDYGPHGKPTQKTYANLTQSIYTYDKNALYRLSTLSTQFIGGTGGSQDATYAVTTLASAVSPSLAEQYNASPATRRTYALKNDKLEGDRGNVHLRVGGSGATFDPQVTLGRWNETTLGIGYRGLGAQRTVSLDNGKVQVDDGTTRVRMYDLAATSTLPDGGYEMDVVLSVKPKSNAFVFDLNTTNLTYVYQPPLSSEPHDSTITNCTATACVNASGVTVIERPEYAVGSYVAYHAQGKQGDFTRRGGANYGTGKAFHIYRPKITDRAGNTTWGTLAIDTAAQTLTVTVPQAFLNKAVYPVTVDPTIGYGTAGASKWSLSNMIRGSLFTTGANEQGTINSVSYYGTVGDATLRTKAAVYAHSNLALLATGSEQTGGFVTSTYGLFTSMVSGAPFVKANTEYVLAAWGDQSGTKMSYISYDNGVLYQGHEKLITYANAFPNPLSGTHSSYKYSIYLTYTYASSTNSAPTTPTTLLAEGQTNPVGVTDSTPEMSAIFNDPDTGDIAKQYRLQVSASSTNWNTLVWDSGTSSMATTTAGVRSPDISYAGSALASSTPYYWRIRFIDAAGSAGPWSTSTASFSLFMPTPSSYILQNIAYTYDVLGNVKSITDMSGTQNAATVLYTYDPLSRLLSASTTAAATAPYKRTYTYDALGNITSASDLGTYTYAGTGYANPHAVTGVGGATYVYDNAGNVTSDGVRANTWDYKNRLAQTVQASTTYRYLYDHSGQRTAYYDGTATTTYPNKYYDVRNAVKTKHIYLGDNLIASIEGNGTATTTNTVYLDHLGGTNVVANASGTAIEALSYYPFGASRVNSKTGVYEQSQKFTGHEFDAGTGLYYMRARYQNPGVGRFVSQDPAYLAIGTQDFEKKYRRSLAQHLSNPQALNAYTYANNNPVTVTDPEGEIVPLLIGAWAAIELALSAYDAYDTAHTVLNPNASVNDKMLSVGGFALGMVAPGGGYGVSFKSLANITEKRILSKVVDTVSAKISSGHAFSKHIDEFADLGIATKHDLSAHVREIMIKPSLSGKLSSGRSVFYDKSTNTAVFVDPKNSDFGSVFRPKNGESYVKNIIKNQKRD